SCAIAATQRPRAQSNKGDLESFDLDHLHHSLLAFRVVSKTEQKQRTPPSFARLASGDHGVGHGAFEVVIEKTAGLSRDAIQACCISRILVCCVSSSFPRSCR